MSTLYGIACYEKRNGRVSSIAHNLPYNSAKEYALDVQSQVAEDDVIISLFSHALTHPEEDPGYCQGCKAALTEQLQILEEERHARGGSSTTTTSPPSADRSGLLDRTPVPSSTPERGKTA